VFKRIDEKRKKLREKSRYQKEITIMTRIEELNQLPEPLKREVLDYAEYLLTKYGMKKQEKEREKWTDVSLRGRSVGETASETVTRMRKEERW
jgi:hypothetical protein